MLTEPNDKSPISENGFGLNGGCRVPAPAVVAWLGLAVSLLFRVSLTDFVTGDYHAFLSKWYDGFVEHGRWGAFKVMEPWSVYPPLYMYLVSLSTCLPVPKLYAIKAISLAADYVAAWYMWRLVCSAWPAGCRSWAAATTFLFLPTVVMNGALWGQCDIMYSAGFLASLFYLLKNRPIAALVAFGVSCSLKPQAIFWCPLLAGLLASARLPWRWLWVPPAVYVGCALPAILAGWPVGKTVFQMVSYSEHTLPGLTLGATNWYQWIFEQHAEVFWRLGIVLTLVATAFFVLWMGAIGTTRQRDNETTGGQHCETAGLQDHGTTGPGGQGRGQPRGLGAEKLVSFALLSVMFPPFLLPGMHERYFFAADVLSVVYAFFVPRGWQVAALVQFASAFTYLPYLFRQEPVPRPLLALAMLAAIGLVVRQLLQYSRAPVPGAAQS